MNKKEFIEQVKYDLNLLNISVTESIQRFNDDLIHHTKQLDKENNDSKL